MQRYHEIAKSVTLAGPTSFASLIRQAIKATRESQEYHILLIIADGQVSTRHIPETKQAIVEASNYALSIVMVGVGDGPWHLMDQFDDDLPERRFDNFQFVEFSKVFDRYPTERRELAFATHALMEIPDQYRAIKCLGLLREGRRLPAFKMPSPICNPPDQACPKDPWYALPEEWDAYWNPANCKQVLYFNKITQKTHSERPQICDQFGGSASD